jgi:hypothetical protein
MSDAPADVKNGATSPKVEEDVNMGGTENTKSEAAAEDVKSETATEAPAVPTVEGMSEDLMKKAAKQSMCRPLLPITCADIFPPFLIAVLNQWHIWSLCNFYVGVTSPVYFYFSDSNLPVDKYFFSLTACNKEGWVPIKTISTFARMKPYTEKGLDLVVAALRTAIASEGKYPLLAVSEDGTNVRRCKALEPQSDVWSRTVYVVSVLARSSGDRWLMVEQKGFGEGDSTENEQAKLEEYFDQFGEINAVRKRREDDKARKGASGFRTGKFKVCHRPPCERSSYLISGLLFRRIWEFFRLQGVPGEGIDT